MVGRWLSASSFLLLLVNGEYRKTFCTLYLISLLYVVDLDLDQLTCLSQNTTMRICSPETINNPFTHRWFQKLRQVCKHISNEYLINDVPTDIELQIQLFRFTWASLLLGHHHI